MAKTNAARRRAFEKKQEQVRASRGAKKRGELAEMAFILKAESLGFEVAKPYGESNRYDFIVRSGQQLWKVQVKSSSLIAWGRYRVHAERTQQGRVIPYTTDEIDFLAAYIVPEDMWFVIPVRAFTPHRVVHVYPVGTADGGPFEKYREAWWLME
jgi:PD-(D/E)XK endonuclease